MLTISIQLTPEQVNLLLTHQDLIITLTNANLTTSAATVAADESAVMARSTSFFSFFRELLKQKSAKCQRTYETYRATYLKFFSFCGANDFALDELTSERLEQFQASLRREQLSMNTVSFYMRILRAVFNRAVAQQLTTDRRLFSHVYTGLARTTKRALSLEQMRLITTLKPDSPQQQLARDMFLFSFYTRGMAFVDIAYLRRQNLSGGMLVYKRHKTGQLITIRWERFMQEIVDRYAMPDSPYLLPLIGKSNGKERSQYRHQQWRINRDLKQIGQKAGLQQPLTFYCARHSWASIAREMNIPIEVISQGMGHQSERTTTIYLKTVAEQTIDRANQVICAALTEPK